ncbi:AsnC family transcriptional regulator [Pseudomonas putida]|jgi:MarR family transcriptional regulator for hemolysin|nr:AsnC family transcriptional regulator [Pseudomonas putida]
MEHKLMKTNQWADMGPRLPAVGQAWRRVLGQRLGDEGLSDATALPIMEIFRAGKKLMRQRELAQRLGLEDSAVVRVLDTLENSGFLRRLEDPADRRAKLLELTDEGRALGLRVEKVAAVLRAELLGGLEPADIDATLRVLTHMAAILEELQVKPRRS